MTQMHAPRLHPLTWLGFGGTCVVELFLLPPVAAVALAVTIAVIYPALAASRLAALRRLSLLFLPVAMAAALVQVAGGPARGEAVWVNLGAAAIGPDRVMETLRVWSRMAGIIALGLAAAERLDVAGIRRTVADLRLPPAAARILLGARAFMRLAEETARCVAEAQALRGVATTGSLVRRVTALPHLLLPVTTNLFIEAAHRSAVLHRRGFSVYSGDVPEPRPLARADIALVTLFGATLALQFFL